MQEQIKAIRQNIDHLMLQCKGLTSNREVALAYTNMQRGTMWLGLVLQGLGTPNPYPSSTDVTSTKIEDRADTAASSGANFEGMPDAERTIQVKWFRAHLDGIIKQIPTTFTNSDANDAAQVAIQALKEAKMWWGWELNNIHVANKGQ